MLARLCFMRLCSIGLCSIALVAASALAQEPGAGGQTVRPEIGKPIQAAIELLKSKKGKEALAKMREAQAVGDRTPYENYLVERVLGQAAAAAGEPSIAARAFENVAASPASPEGERRQFLAAAASQYYLTKNYAKTTELAARYFKDGGTEKSVRTIYVQALYLGNDFAGAARELLKDLEAEERENKAPAEEQLQLLANSCAQIKDAACYGKAMEMLVAHYPKRDYWLSVIYSIATRPGFSERLALDVARIKIETGTMRGADEYLDAAQLSLQDGFPMEAVRIIDKGYASGVLGTGAEAARHRRLKDMAARNLAEDKKALARDGSQSGAAKDGRALFNEGFNYVLLGKPEQGLALMEKGIRDAKAFRRLEHAKLELGYAYHLAGQNQKAIQILRTVQGTDGAAALARLWAIRLSRAS
ncbi:MAG TPA: hypothetical protein VEL09_06795 [Burkholderiales bacterium]|nr:hypothetical protein [Burkholderiales bacterium]